MNTPGSTLRTEREKQKRSLEEIAKKLKIKIEYLRAIEDDNYQVLPAEVFTKAYIRLYADVLHVNSDELLRLYKDKSAVVPPVEPIPQDTPKAIHYKPIIVIAVVLLIAVLAFVITTRNEQKPVEEVVNKIIESDEIVNEVAVEEKESEEISLEVIAEELTWVSVSIDGARPKEWLLKTGGSMILIATESFVIKVGNAGGTKLILNGIDIGKLGPHGKVVDIVLP